MILYLILYIIFIVSILSLIYSKIYLYKYKNSIKKCIGYRVYKYNIYNRHYVYAFLDFPFIKIGKTRNVIKRLNTHKTSHAILIILCIIPVKEAYIAESYLHTKYKLYRFDDREFFWINPIMLFDLYLLNHNILYTKIKKKLNE